MRRCSETINIIPLYQSLITMKVRCTALSSDEGPHFELLASAGFEVLSGNRQLNYWDQDQLISEVADCVAVIAGVEPYTAEVLKSLPSLRVIARTGVGFDTIDLDYCDEAGIVVSTTPGVNHHAVAEHTIALLMAVARGFPDRDQLVRKGTWIRFNTPRVMGSTLGLIGLGRIGKAVATRAIGLGMNVVAYDPYPDQEFINKHQIKSVTLEELWSQADYVSLHLPSGPATDHIINKETLSQMKPGAVLINTARGSLVNEQDLCDAIRSKHLLGAGLDVFETEPLPLQSPLLELDRVLLSGHLAGLDEQSQSDMLIMSAETIIALHQKEWPAFCIQNLKECKNWSWAN